MLMEKNVLIPREYNSRNDKKVGLMGGTFNPVHFGHLLLAEMAMSEAGLDEVWFLPAKNPPHKIGYDILSGEIRKELLKLAIEGNRAFSICDEELRREGISYTFETLLSLRKKYGNTEFYFIMGMDSLSEFVTWKRPDIILENSVLLVGDRDLAGRKKMEEKISMLKSMYEKCRIIPVSMPEFLISSKAIRARIAEGKSIRYLVPESVRNYIADRELYRDSIQAFKGILT